MNLKRGFSLIELMMVIVIIAVIAGMAGSMLSVGFRSYFASKPIMSNANTVNIAMANLMREMKSASSFTSLGTTAVTFLNRSGQSITFDINGTTLRRNDGSGAQTLCTNVSSITFAYYDSALAVTAVAANVRYVTLNLTLTNNSAGSAIYKLMSGTLIRANL